MGFFSFLKKDNMITETEARKLVINTGIYPSVVNVYENGFEFYSLAAGANYSIIVMNNGKCYKNNRIIEKVLYKSLGKKIKEKSYGGNLFDSEEIKLAYKIHLKIKQGIASDADKVKYKSLINDYPQIEEIIKSK